MIQHREAAIGRWFQMWLEKTDLGIGTQCILRAGVRNTTGWRKYATGFESGTAGAQ